MEIKYDANNSYAHYNESQGAYLNRNKIIKNKAKIYTFCGTGLLYLIYTIAFTLCYLLFLKLDIQATLLMYVLRLMYVFIILYFGIFINGYFKNKKNNKGGTIVFDEEGITDISSKGIKVGFTWDKLKYVIMKDHTITFIFDKVPVIIFLDINKKEDVKKALKKYNKDSLIIED